MLNSFGRKVEEFAHLTAEKSKYIAKVSIRKTNEAANAAKIKIEINKEKHNLRNLFEHLGEVYYEEVFGEATSNVQSIDVCNEINNLKEKLKSLESTLAK